MGSSSITSICVLAVFDKSTAAAFASFSRSPTALSTHRAPVPISVSPNAHPNRAPTNDHHVLRIAALSCHPGGDLRPLPAARPCSHIQPFSERCLFDGHKNAACSTATRMKSNGVGCAQRAKWGASTRHTSATEDHAADQTRLCFFILALFIKPRSPRQFDAPDPMTG